MSDIVLAATIAASATVLTSLLQLKATLTRGLAARAQNVRRKGGSRQLILVLMMLIAAGVGGYTVAQWSAETERAEQAELRHELQARIADLSYAAEQLEETRAQVRTEIRDEVLRELGTEGVVSQSTVEPCKPMPVVGAPVGAGAAAGFGSGTGVLPAALCTEAEAIEVSICAAVPARANIAEIELYTRLADQHTPWNENRVLAGHEAGEARFSETPVTLPDEAGTKLVCHGFANWSSHATRVARMVVRYTL